MDFPVKNGDTQGAQKCCRLQKTLKVTCLSKKCFSFPKKGWILLKLKENRYIVLQCIKIYIRISIIQELKLGSNSQPLSQKTQLGVLGTVSTSVCPSETTKNCLFHNNIGLQFLIIYQLIGFLSSIMSSCFFSYEILYIIQW